ncbi:MAG TPA: AI-2E family transporter [Candidatus Sulfomarinibacteraceae bacterium]|nr:AI-2E family transporter [Candidatus Sulfomarinibacteraceae bacterium]
MAAVARRLPPMSPRVALLATAALVVGIVLYAGREALGPFVVGLLIVYLLTPPIEWLARHRLPRWLAILIVYAGAALLVVEGLNLMLRPLVEQVRQFAADLPGLIDRLRAQLEQVGALYRGLELPPAIRDAVDEWLARLAAGDVGFDPAVLLPVLRATTGLVATVFAFLIIPVWAFYLLKDRPSLIRSFEASIPPEWAPDISAVVAIIGRVFGSWIRAQVLLGAAVGIATFVGLLILGATVDPIFSRFAVLLAVIAGVLELLPIIGPIIAAVPAILIAATAGLEAAGAAFLLYLAIQQIENNVLVPKIQGDATELHPSAVMLALVIGGAVAGLLGAILALPVTAAARDVYKHLFARLSVPVRQAPSGGVPAAAVDGPATPQGAAADPVVAAAGAVAVPVPPVD